MDGTWVLILLALVMLVGSYVAGSIPLNVSMSEVRKTAEKLSIILVKCKLKEHNRARFEHLLRSYILVTVRLLAMIAIFCNSFAREWSKELLSYK